MSESGKPGRYQRSASGLVGALLVTVLVVLAVVVHRAIWRTSPEYEPEAVDYLEAISALQGAGARPIYPDPLPEGWIATDIDVTTRPGSSAEGSAEPDEVGLNLLTDDDRYVGVRQSDSSASSLLGRYLGDPDAGDPDAEVEQIAPLRIEGSVARIWEGWAAPDGDLAYTAEVRGRQVVVYGSAGTDPLRQVLERLTDEPVDD